VATRLPATLERAGGWRDTAIDLGGPATDVITGRRVDRELPLAELLDTYPVALLVR
jgi:(1->4)-alpha-D-glucan 1-alpha-D-glucosylmutase